MQGMHQTTNFDVGGTTSFTDRRLRPHNHHLNNHQPLNCPRCDSLSTKFCYYNNYNLSQPRHFCKNCRRYWTNGGVLRNVPVGGRCRKSKRPSKTKVKNSASVSRKAVHMSHSSSESSSNNGAATSDLQANIFQATVVTVPSNGEFMSLKNNDQNSTPTITTSFNQFMPSQIDWELGKLNGSNGVLTPTVRIDDLLENKGHYIGVTTLDWEHPTAANALQGLFDFTTTADPQAYWTQAMSTVAQDDTHWSHNTTTNDHSLFLP